MIFNWLTNRLPPWLAVPICAVVYAAAIAAVWWRWGDPGAPFRYAGL